MSIKLNIRLLYQYHAYISFSNRSNLVLIYYNLYYTSVKYNVLILCHNSPPP